MIIFGVLAMLIGVALIFVVVIQNSKGGGLSSTFAGGSATQVLGARRSAEYIEKLTWYLAGGLAVIAFVANIAMSNTGEEDSILMQEQIQNQIITTPQVQDPGAFQAPTEPSAE